MNSKHVLEKVGATSLIGGAQSWGQSLSPYSDSQIKRICYDRDFAMSQELLRQHSDFTEKYNNLDNSEKAFIREWVVESFLSYSWAKRDIGIRPRWTWDNFLSNQSGKGKSYLDIGPCHGIHSNLIYKEMFKGQFDFHSADILPPYLQVQHLCGVNTHFFDASMSDIVQVVGSESHDIVLFTEVLEHLTKEEGERILVGISKILKKSGKVMISFPVDAKPFDYFSNIAFGHQYQPNVGEVVSILRDQDVKIESQTVLWSGKTEQHVLFGHKE